MRRKIAAVSACLAMVAFAVEALANPPPADPSIIAGVEYVGADAGLYLTLSEFALESDQVDAQDLLTVPIADPHQVAVEMKMPAAAPAIAVTTLDRAAAREVGGIGIRPSRPARADRSAHKG